MAWVGWKGKAGLMLQPVDPCESRGWALPHTLYCLAADATVTPRACPEDPQLASSRRMGRGRFPGLVHA